MRGRGRLLRRGAQARIVNLASAAIAMWKRDPFEDVRVEARYLGSDAYARAKLLNVMWTFALARRLAGSGMVANVFHPGLSWTSMTASIEPRALQPWMRAAWPLVRWLQRRGSPEAAARTPIFLAGAAEAAGVSGTYFDSDGRRAKVPQPALDRALQERAWTLAEALVASAPTRRVRKEVTA